MFDLIRDESISVFGTSAKFLSAVEKTRVRPVNGHGLDSLHTILSTGSPLPPEGFQFVYEHIKKDLCLSSISGGTDLISCFVLGNPTLPVYAGEIQCAGLGMDVQVFNDAGESVLGEKGELVCTQVFPAVPIGFWNDDDDSKLIRRGASSHFHLPPPSFFRTVSKQVKASRFVSRLLILISRLIPAGSNH